MSTANLIPKGNDGLRMLPRFQMRVVPDELYVIVVALAISKLSEWGRTPSGGFFDWISYVDSKFASFDELPDNVRESVEATIRSIYTPGATTYENPIDRQRRLARSGFGFQTTSAKSLAANMLDLMPKRFVVPYRTV